ncbi:MAG: MFS transporter [Gammaproteobacteria bacterium]
MQLDRRQLTGLLGLGTALALGSTGQIMMATISAIVGANLAPTPQLATLPVTAGILGVATAALPAATLIRRHGRRPVFVVALLWGAAGACLATASIHAQSFIGFCAGCFVMGNNMAVMAQYRFAAAELVATPLISRVVAGMMLGTLGAAVLAPWIALRYRHLLPVEFSGSFAVLPLLYLAAAAIVALLPLDGAQNSADQPIAATPLGAALARREVRLAIACAACGYGVMSLVMTATPISMHVMDNHSVEATADVIRSHLLAMFTPSLVSGWLIARVGLQRILWLGVWLNVACIAFAVSGHEIWQYRFALITLGVGWNFLFVGGTTLLATVCRGDEGRRVQGVNDFVMFATMAAASLSAGALLDGVGWVTTNLIALALLMPVVFGLLRARFAAEPAGAESG